MSIEPEIKALLIEIRDNQRLSIERQEEHLAIAREQMERARAQIDQSIGLQKEAITRAKQAARIAIPGIIVCLAAVVYLVVRFF